MLPNLLASLQLMQRLMGRAKQINNKLLSDNANSSFPVFGTEVSGQRRRQLNVCLSNMSIKSPHSS
jgi:hypothetical protein